MNIFPAIVIYEGSAVRLFKGDYAQMTVYDKEPLRVAQKFADAGAEYIHLVDLEGAKTGLTPNIETVANIVKNTSLFVELGGGIRSMETIEKYLSIGVNRVILGTAAITNATLVDDAIQAYGEKIAVGVDVKDGFVAIKGWTEKSEFTFADFCKKMQDKGVKTLICTDISKDGAMKGTNRELYRRLNSELQVNIVASGGVSTIDDVRALSKMELYGAIIGKAYYTGAIDLKEAIEVAKQ